jgi:hypothetical protein
MTDNWTTRVDPERTRSFGVEELHEAMFELKHRRMAIERMYEAKSRARDKLSTDCTECTGLSNSLTRIRARAHDLYRSRVV